MAAVVVAAAVVVVVEGKEKTEADYRSIFVCVARAIGFSGSEGPPPYTGGFATDTTILSEGMGYPNCDSSEIQVDPLELALCSDTDFSNAQRMNDYARFHGGIFAEGRGLETVSILWELL